MVIGEMKNWKKDQINYFKKYLENFEVGSREYQMIKNGIEELQKSN